MKIHPAEITEIRFQRYIRELILAGMRATYPGLPEAEYQRVHAVYIERLAGSMRPESRKFLDLAGDVSALVGPVSCVNPAQKEVTV